MAVGGGIHHNDVAKEAIDSILTNSSMIDSIPVIKDMNLTQYKDRYR